MTQQRVATTVTLREVTDENRAAVEKLRVAPGQERFVDSVPQSLKEAAETAYLPWFRAIYAGEAPVGFVMLADDDPTCPWRYYLWRLLVDERFQRQGYGRAALHQVVAYVRTRPGAEALVTSAVPGDGSPVDFYLRYGFRPTGQVKDGEQVLELRWE